MNGSTLHNQTSSSESLIATLPPPAIVRQRLGETLREVKLLRQLLKVSERAARPARELAHA